MKPSIGGRPSLLQKHDITLDDLIEAYHTDGSYEAVARRYNTTSRTIQKYLGPAKIAKIGRPFGTYTSTARRWIEDHIDVLTMSDKDILEQAVCDGVSASYMRKVLQAKRSRIGAIITRRVREVLRENVAIRDTKGRYIPVKAIRYVWLPRWHWNTPVYARVVLRDGTKAKVFTAYTPVPADVSEQ